MPVRDLLNAASGTGGATDPYFYDVSLLLNGDGTNGAQNNTFLDSSSNAFTITRNGNTTQGSFSPYGNLWSNYFNGSSYLTWSGTTVGTGAMTFECWFFYTGSFSGEVSFIGPGSAITGGLGCNIVNATTVSFDAYGIVGLNYTVPTIVPNTWNHIAFVRNSSNVETVFLNGTRSSTGTNTDSYSYTTSAAVGYTGGAVPRNFNGYISNARLVVGSNVYDPTQTTITVPTAPLTAIANTQLLSCQSNRFLDNSSNNYTLSTSGSPSVQRFSPFNPTAPYDTTTIGGSGYFDGSSYLSIANNSAIQLGSNNWTISLWFYLTAVNIGSQDFVSFGFGGANNTRSYIVYLDNNNLRVSQSPDGTTSNDTSLGLPTIVPYTWYNLVVSRSGSVVQGFLNGVAGTSLTAYDLYAYNGPLYISYQNGNGHYVNGYICDLRIVNGTGVTSVTVPTAPLTNITNTALLANFTNAGIPDLAMQNNLQTVGSAQVSTSVVKYGTGSLSFNGSTDWLSTASNQSAQFNAGDFTIECWMYPTSLSGANVFHCYGYQTTSTRSTLAYLNGGNIRFAYSPDGSTSTDSSLGAHGMSINNWYYVAIVRNGTTVTAYVNGTALSSPINISTTSVYNSAQPLVIGSDTTGDNFAGYIDDYRITKGYARYTSNFTPPTSALPTY